MNDHLTDFIRHFIGYWHLDDFLNKHTLVLKGDGQSSDAVGEIYVVASDFMPRDHDFSGDLTAIQNISFDFSAPSLPRLDPATLITPPKFGVPIFTPETNVPAGASSPAASSASGGFLPFKASYNLGYPTAADLDTDIFITQKNWLVDNDHIVLEGAQSAHFQLVIDINAFSEILFETVREASAGLVNTPFQERDPNAFLQKDTVFSALDGESKTGISVGDETGETDIPKQVSQDFSALQGRYVDSSNDEDDLAPEPAETETSETLPSETLSTVSQSEETNVPAEDSAAQKNSETHQEAPIPATSHTASTPEDLNNTGDAATPETTENSQTGETSQKKEAGQDIYEAELAERLDQHFARPETQAGASVEETRQSPEKSGSTEDSSGSEETPEPDSFSQKQVIQPDPLASNQIATGENLAINAAQIVTVSDGHGGLIVQGDYHEINTIAQVNVLHDNDLQITDGLDESVSDNLAINDATFSARENPDQDRDFYGSELSGNNWKLSVHDGNFFDVTSVFQQNSLVDNDTALFTPTESALTLITGDNLQIDQVNIFRFSDPYDLIIVDGDYYEYNTIIQVNLMIDDDVVYADNQAGNNQDTRLETPSVETHDNGQYNTASITNIGGAERFQELTDDASDLVDFAQGDAEDLPAELPADLAATLPGNGGTTLNVLYVTGDYYDITSITQINVLFDLDNVQLTSPGLLTEGDVQAGQQTHDLSTGQNTQLNTATIVDVDSPSSYQYLGGDYYEDSFLVQADIFLEEEDFFYDEADLADQDIAFLADDTLAGAEQEDLAGQSCCYDSTLGDDVMGAITG